MRILVAAVALSLPAIASAKELPKKITCEVTGSWYCNTEPEGICIDGGGKIRGERYKFNIAQRTYVSPTGKGTISAPAIKRDGLFSSGQEVYTFTLSDGRTFHYESNRQQGDEGDYAMSYLILTPDHANESRELRCKP